MIDIAESLVGNTRSLGNDGRWGKQGDTSAFFLAAEFGVREKATIRQQQQVSTAEAIAGLLNPAILQ